MAPSYAMVETEIAGGLNNMIMNVAQLVSDTCAEFAAAREILVLPRFTVGKNFFKKRGEGYNNESMPFSELFDVAHFERYLRPCKVVETLPPRANYRIIKVVRVNKFWRYHSALPKVYGALRAGPAVMPFIVRAERTIEARAGTHWSAVHLRIESDWMFVARFCDLKRYTPRRCFTPTEVAQITERSREHHNSTGVLLLYAAELVSRTGPYVEPQRYGQGVVKLPYIANASYTVRAAVEMFLAARAPAGFYGNSYSTFSRGVSILRASRKCPNERRRTATASGGASGVGLSSPPKPRSPCLSFAYDCGEKFEKAGWLPSGCTTVDPDSCVGAAAPRAKGLVGSLEESQEGTTIGTAGARAGAGASSRRKVFNDVWNGAQPSKPSPGARNVMGRGSVMGRGVQMERGAQVGRGPQSRRPPSRPLEHRPQPQLPKHPHTQQLQAGRERQTMPPQSQSAQQEPPLQPPQSQQRQRLRKDAFIPAPDGSRVLRLAHTRPPHARKPDDSSGAPHPLGWRAASREDRPEPGDA